MRVGLALPSFDFSVPGQRPLRWPSVVSDARLAEDLGFHSVWLPDGPGALDPIVALAGLARQTGRLRLGTLVLAAPRRPATVLAKSLATLDVLSGGRLVAGIGAGHDHPASAGRLAETIQVLKGMWGGGPFSFDGDHVRAVGAHCRPRPVQRPGPPVWVGGRSDRLLAAAAAHGDGWNMAWTATPEEYRRRTAALRAACERAGRAPGSVALSVGLSTLVGESRADLARRYASLQDVAPPGGPRRMSLEEWRRGRLVGTVEQVREQLAEWGELGVAELIVAAGPVPFVATRPEDVGLIASAANLAGDGNALWT